MKAPQNKRNTQGPEGANEKHMGKLLAWTLFKKCLLSFFFGEPAVLF